MEENSIYSELLNTVEPGWNYKEADFGWKRTYCGVPRSRARDGDSCESDFLKEKAVRKWEKQEKAGVEVRQSPASAWCTGSYGAWRHRGVSCFGGGWGLLYPAICQSQAQTKWKSFLKEPTQLGGLSPYSFPLLLPAGGMQIQWWKLQQPFWTLRSK